MNIQIPDKLKKQLLCFTILLMSTTLVFGQPQNVNYPNLGLSFGIPEGWTGQESNGIYLLGHTSIPGLIAVVPHGQPLTIDQMRTEVEAGLQFDVGTVLRRESSISSIGSDAVGGEFTGTFDYAPARAYIIGLANPEGNGVTIISITTPELYESSVYRDLAMKLKNSVVFSKVAAMEVEPSSNASSKADLADWKYQLGGTKLTYMDSYYSGGEYGGGYNMKTEIHLCLGGYYLYYDQSFVAAGGVDVSGYSAENSKGHGEWDIQIKGSTVYLLLQFYDDQHKQFALEWGENYELYLDGYRYYRTWEGEQAPNCFD